MSDVKRFSLRLSGGLHAALVREAERERRSVHSLVLLILEERFGGKPVKREEAPRSSSKDGGGGRPEVKPAKAPVESEGRPSVGYTAPREFAGAIPKPGKGKK